MRDVSSTDLVNWYRKHARVLPWRREPRNPYHVVVSEFMLQQTQVDRVVPRFESFVARFPSFEALAGASEDEVLAEWSGLGYYRRARLLREGARAVVSEHDGVVPSTRDELAKLPGIIGVKDATGDLARVSHQRLTCGPDFVQLSGEDATALGFNAQGGVGCISVTANVAPKLCAEFQEATLAGDYAKALEYQDKLIPLHIAIFVEPGLVGAKYALSRLGLCSEEVRLPLTPLTDGAKAQIDAAMAHAGLL